MDIAKMYGVFLVLIVVIESTLSATSNVNADSHQDEELEVQLATLPRTHSNWEERTYRGFRRPVPTRSGASPGGFKPSGFRDPINTATVFRYNGFRGSGNGFRGSDNGFRGSDNGFRGSDNGFRGSGNAFRGNSNGFRGSNNGFSFSDSGFRGSESGFRNSEDGTTTNASGGFRSS